MSRDEIKASILLVAVFVFGALCGFFTGKVIYQPKYEEKVARDTVILHDTIPDYTPMPKDSATIKYVTRWLPSATKTDTITKWDYFVIHDSVAVEVPITSKHYQSEQYDAWVSGFEPSLDSIFVYQERQIITETITRTVKESKHFFLDVGAGCEYRFNTKDAVPFAELGFKFKKGKVGIGAYGGYSHDTKENKGLPYARAKVTYDILVF